MFNLNDNFYCLVYIGAITPPIPSSKPSKVTHCNLSLPFFVGKKKITAFLQTPIKDEGEGVPSWEKKIDIKLWSVEDVLIVGGRWEGIHFM